MPTHHGSSPSIAHQPDTIGATQSRLLRAALRFSLFVLIVVSLSYWGLCVWNACIDLSYDIDFSTFFAAALALRDNAHANIFDLHTLQVVAAAHGARVPQYLYIYPQVLAILLIPLTLLPYDAALVVWRLMSLVLWLAGAGILVRWSLRYCAPSMDASSRPTSEQERTGTHRPSDRQLFVASCALLLSLAYFPLAYGVHEGQVVSLLFFLMLLAAFLSVRHPRLVGGLLALALWIKVYPVVLVGYFFLTKQWRVVRSAVMWTLAIGAGTLLFVGGHGMSLLVKGIVSNGNTMGRIPWNVTAMNVPLWIFASIGVPGGSMPRLLGYALAATIGGIFVAALVYVQRVGPRVSSGDITTQHKAAVPVLGLLGCSWAMCTTVVLSPVTWVHTYAWLLPSVIVCLGVTFRWWLKLRHNLRAQIRGAGLLLALLVAYAAVSAPPHYYDASLSLEQILAHHPLNLMLQLFHPVGALMLWGINGHLLLRMAGVSYRRLLTSRPALLASIPGALGLVLASRPPSDTTGMFSSGEHPLYPSEDAVDPPARFWVTSLIVMLVVLAGVQMLYWQIASAASGH